MIVALILAFHSTVNVPFTINLWRDCRRMRFSNMQWSCPVWTRLLVWPENFKSDNPVVC